MLIEHEHARLMHGTHTRRGIARPAIRNCRRRQAVRDVIVDAYMPPCGRKTAPQLLGQLPADRLRPGPVFDKVGVDYAGQPWSSPDTSVSLSYKGLPIPICLVHRESVHLEPVSDLTTEAF